MNGRISLSFQPGPNSESEQDVVLQNIVQAVEQMGQEQRWSQQTVFRVNLVLEELSINVLQYGGDAPGTAPGMNIEVDSQEGVSNIEVSDDGRPFDPLTQAPNPPVVTSQDQPAPVGGMGIHLVRNMVENLAYRHDRGRNRLTMTVRDE